MSNISITAVKYAESWLAERMIFANSASETLWPISFTVYLLAVKGRLILCDAGCETMPDFDMRCFLSPDKILDREGISPASITDIIITHHHHDHIESVKNFPKARIYMQKDELALSSIYLSQTEHVISFEETYMVCPGVQIVKIGGHSVGSCIVRITTCGREYVIAGDECYLPECLTRGIPTGTSEYPDKSRAFIAEYAKSEYTVLLCHDPSILPGRNGLLRII